MVSTLFPETNIYRGAVFSPCRRYRYKLWRRWSDTKPLNFLMLNPSTADETVNDPTVEGCERRAREWGYGGVVVTNLFAFRATDPEEMKRCGDPVGIDNNDHIRREYVFSAMTICAWGNHGAHMNRSATVRKLLSKGVLHALKLNKSGEPQHPLYIARSVKPFVWKQGN